MKVAIVGYGVEGQSAYNYFAQKGADITIFDESERPKFTIPRGAKLIVGKDSLKQLNGFDLVVRVPALHPDRLVTDGEVTSLTNEFFKACPAPIIGVTGSKGKGTISTLIYDMLTAAGKKAHLAGNIGIPALDILPDVSKHDVVVLELSSFQLWDLRVSPQTAVVGMVEPEHLDVHTSVNEYLSAKANIAKWQKPQEVTIYLQRNELTQQVATLGHGKKIAYPTETSAHVEDGWFVMSGKRICPTGDLHIPGQHNIENTCAAITATWQYTQDAQAIAKAIAHFTGLDHRLKFIKEVRGVRYFDDSIATTPGSAIAALKAFDAPKVLIVGGSDKGADFTELARLIAAENMRATIVIGAMRDRIIAALQKNGYNGKVETFDVGSSMQAVVATAADLAREGDVVLLSPACASFDMFKSYQDRGEQFIAAVSEL